MTAEEALAVRRQRNSRAARAARGRQLLQVSAAAEPEPEPETSGSSVQVSPGVRRVSLFQCLCRVVFRLRLVKSTLLFWLFVFSRLQLPQCVDEKINVFLPNVTVLVDWA